MTRAASTPALLASAVLALALAAPVDARAEIVAPQPVAPGGRATRAFAVPARRIRRPPRVPVGPPPIRQVRAALNQAQPAIQACATQYEPPGRGRTRRMRVRVWLYPTGRWTMEVPELTARRPGQPHSYAALRSCMRAAIASRIQGHMRRFRGRARQKVERAFRVRMPGPPPSATELTRRVTRRRRQLLTCVPGAGSRGEQAQLTVRGTLETNGHLTITGVGLPEGVPFDAAAACVSRSLAPVTTDAVTETRAFEATIRFRYQAPTPTPPPATQPAGTI